MTEHALSLAEFLDADICSNKHGGSLESKDAFNGMRHAINAMHEEILAAFERFGDLTAKESAEILGKPLHTVSGRCSELKALLYLEKVPGLRRDGGAVLRRTDKRRP